MTSALAGLRVLDLSDSISGGWCTRLMADFGANVIVVEPSEGLAIRALVNPEFDREGLLAALRLTIQTLLRESPVGRSGAT